MSCLDNIVKLGVCPDEGASLSGLYLTQAGGMSIKNFADIANETYTSGINLALEKKQLVLTQFKNDFIGELQKNSIVTAVVNPEYDTSVFNPTVQIDGGNDRGVILHKANWRGDLRKTYLKKIQVYPLTSGTGTITITDGYTAYAYEVEFNGNQVNEFDSTHFSILPYVVRNNNVEVTISDTSVVFASAEIKCGRGCNNTLPNQCGWADGWNGTGQDRRQGYGVNIIFQCVCDYESILCSNPALFGELMYIKWQMAIYDEQYKSNRFDGLVIYNHKDINEVIMPQLYREYSEKWQGIMGNIKNILSVYKDDCIVCTGIRRVVNI